MAVDTAKKRCSALSAWLPWSFGSVPSGVVNRQDALWSYTGIVAAGAVVPEPEPEPEPAPLSFGGGSYGGGGMYYPPSRHKRVVERIKRRIERKEGKERPEERPKPPPDKVRVEPSRREERPAFDERAAAYSEALLGIYYPIEPIVTAKAEPPKAPVAPVEDFVPPVEVVEEPFYPSDIYLINHTIYGPRQTLMAHSPLAFVEVYGPRNKVEIKSPKEAVTVYL